MRPLITEFSPRRSKIDHLFRALTRQIQMGSREDARPPDETKPSEGEDLRGICDNSLAINGSGIYLLLKLPMKATWGDIETALVEDSLESKDKATLEAFWRVEPPPSTNPAFHFRFQQAKERIRRCLDQIQTEELKLRPASQHGTNRKKRVKVPKAIEKRVFQEAGSKCSFCSELEIVCLQVHHIDGDPANNVLHNLLLVCATCHTKITAGIISEKQTRAKKTQLAGSKTKSSKTASSMNS